MRFSARHYVLWALEFNDMKQNKIDENWLHKSRFPRSSQYDLQWMLDNEMGPNAVWFAEELSKKLRLEAGMRVLDMGCGRAMTSLFWAREFQVQVFANDLWISADDNWQRVKAAHLEHAVFPIHAEAHNLPYAAGFFDAVVSVDAYQYFGTDDLYLGYMTRYLKDGGQLGLVMPALMRDFKEPPEHLTRVRESGTSFWDPTECWCLHTLDWWKRHFERSGLVDFEEAKEIENGCQLWLDWERIRDGGGFTGFPSEAATLEEDAGRYLGFVLLVVRKRPRPKRDFDHALKIRL
jgi:cyclopropane fatty-acyl-phospholipid synthase-like methyltransferase